MRLSNKASFSIPDLITNFVDIFPDFLFTTLMLLIN